MSCRNEPSNPNSGAGADTSCDETTKTCTLQECPQVEIEINNTSATNDDLVQLQCTHPARLHNISCRIRAQGGGTGNATIVLTNPDGRLRFPNAGDTTKTVTVPRNGAWVPFEISGETSSNALNDAVIEAHCNTAAGTLKGSKTVTVFWFDQAETGLTRGGNYTFVGNTYTVSGGVAVSYGAKARIRPAGVDCTAPQVTHIRVGIMQEIDAYTQGVTWSNPTIAWLGAAPSGTTVNVPTTMRLATTFGAGVTYPVADTEASVAPLYDQPGKHGTLDSNSLQQPIGCQAGGATIRATSYDTPSNPAPPTFALSVNQGATHVGTVTWTRINATRDENFRLYCVLYNTHSRRFCALREATWSIHLNSAAGGAQRATVTADGPVRRTPATGVAANNAPHTQNNNPVGTATTAFTKP